MRRSAPGCGQKTETTDVTILATEVMKWKRQLEGRKEKYERYKAEELNGIKMCERLLLWLTEVKSRKLPCKVPDDWALTIMKGRTLLRNLQKVLSAYQRLIEEEEENLHKTKDILTSATPLKVEGSKLLQTKVTSDNSAIRIEAEAEGFIVEYGALDITSLLQEVANFQSSMTQDRFPQTQQLQQQPQQVVPSVLPPEIRSEVISAFRSAYFPEYKEPLLSLDDAKQRLEPYAYLPLLSNSFPGSEQNDEGDDNEPFLCAFDERLESIEDELHKFDATANSPPTATDSFVWESILRSHSQIRIRRLTNILHMSDSSQFLDASATVQPPYAAPKKKLPEAKVLQNDVFGSDIGLGLGTGLNDLLKFNNNLKRQKKDEC